MAQLTEDTFYRFVREERLFCGVLVHLLLQRGGNLAAFLELVNSTLPGSPLGTSRLEEAEVYPEFTFLRDHWNGLGRDNAAKRALILELLERAGVLAAQIEGDLPDEVPQFNEFFVGPRGRKILRDIVYPGSWSVATLAERLEGQPQAFRDFCRFKWAFNIKPDIVVLIPGSGPLCIEAKLESGEGQYPASQGERAIFDRMFGRGGGRVQQVELQRFMFERLLATPCHLLIIGRTPVGKADKRSQTPFLTWTEAFRALDVAASIPYVHKLIGENVHLRAP